MTTISRRLTLSPELRRFTRFITVGALGTCLDFGLLTVLKLIGFPTLIANSLSFTTGLTNNYILNSRWTFAGRTQNNGWRQFIQFGIVSLVGLALNNAIVLTLETPFGTLINDPAWGYLPAKVMATGLVVFWNYFANRYWTFK